jgi:hypothetical protein
MPVTQSQSNDPHEFVKRSSLYQEFLAEREAILKHKWLESERMGKDIGFDGALISWVRNHRDAWWAKRRCTRLTGDTEQSASLPRLSETPHCIHEQLFAPQNHLLKADFFTSSPSSNTPQ